ncbi:hypothetical protein D3C72_1304450 [compost metagenome]
MSQGNRQGRQAAGRVDQQIQGGPLFLCLCQAVAEHHEHGGNDLEALRAVCRRGTRLHVGME